MYLKLVSTLLVSVPLWSQVGGITTVAGFGNAGLFGGGFSGDKGLATSAQFRAPQGVVSGPEGSLYVVDTGNNRVRRVGADGIVDTIPGGFLTGAAKQIVV